MLESVRVKRIKKTAKLWQFEYRPMDAGEPGIIEFTVKENTPVDHRIENLQRTMLPTSTMVVKLLT